MAGFENGMGGVFEGQAGEDDLGERGPGDVDAGPKAIGAEEDAIAGLGKMAGEVAAGEIEALAERTGGWPWSRAGSIISATARRSAWLVKRTREPPCTRRSAKGDHVGKPGEVETAGAGGGVRGVGGDEDAEIFFEIERGVFDTTGGGGAEHRRGRGRRRGSRRR